MLYSFVLHLYIFYHLSTSFWKNNIMDVFLIICISFFIVNILFILMSLVHSIFADRGKEVQDCRTVSDQNLPRESVLSSKSNAAYHGGYRGSIVSLPHVILYNSIVHSEPPPS